MKASFIVALTGMFASAVHAWTQPVGAAPSGNPIYTPSLQEQVPVGQQFSITWGPTTTGTVTILLLHGPSDNCVPLYALGEKLPNSGTFTWTPSTDLTLETTHYGIEIIDDATGAYQYSTQFGIVANPALSSSSTSAAASSTSSSAAAAASSAAPSSAAAAASSAAPSIVSSAVISVNSATQATPSSFAGYSTSGNVVFETQIQTITSCGPEVTNCPARSHSATAAPSAPAASSSVLAQPSTPAAATSVPVPSAISGVAPIGSGAPAPPIGSGAPAPPAGNAASSSVLAHFTMPVGSGSGWNTTMTAVPIVASGTGVGVPGAAAPTGYASGSGVALSQPTGATFTGAAGTVRAGGFLVAVAAGLAVFMM